MEEQHNRKLHPVLAFIAGLFALGLGYVYLGRLRAGVAAFFGVYAMLGFFMWTRLAVVSAALWWMVWVGIFVYVGIFLIHPCVIAAKQRYAATRWYNRWWFYLLLAIVEATIVLTISVNRATVFGFEPFRIPSVSMSPTIEEGDFVMADTWRYRFHDAAVGEVVIVERPQTPGVKYIKRVVAVGGDSFEMRNGVFYRNGHPINETYLHAQGPFQGAPRDIPLSTLRPGLVYLLGDYRDNSLDSRQWGPFATSSLHGRVQYIWLSIDKESRFRWNRVGLRLRP